MLNLGCVTTNDVTQCHRGRHDHDDTTAAYHRWQASTGKAATSAPSQASAGSSATAATATEASRSCVCNGDLRLTVRDQQRHRQPSDVTSGRNVDAALPRPDGWVNFGRKYTVPHPGLHNFVITDQRQFHEAGVES